MGVVSAYQSIYSNEERGVVLGWTVAYGQKIAAEYELLLGRYIAFLPTQRGKTASTGRRPSSRSTSRRGSSD